MAITAFPVEAFRPWKTPRPKPIPRPRPSHAHDHNAPVPVRSSPALPRALHAPAPPHSLDSQQNNQQHPLPARPPAEVCVHGNLRPDIRQSACPELSEEPVPASGGPNELSVSELDESPAVSAMRAATSPQAQTRCGLPASDLNRLGDAVTTDISIGSQRSIQGAAECRSPSENPASSAQQTPGPHEPAVIPIDPVILRDEIPLESNQPYRDIQDSDTLWSSQQELPCPYPEPPIVPHSIFDNDHPSLGLIDENRPATHRHCGERSRQTHPGNNAESNGSSPRGPWQQHCNSDVIRAEQRKRPSTGSDKRKRRRNKRQRLEERTPSPAGNSCASLRFHFLSLPTNARLEFLSWLLKSEGIRKYEPWQAASLISRVLEKPYKGLIDVQFVGIADEPPSESRSTQVQAFSALYGSLKRLFGNVNSFGGLAIAKTVLFLWRRHFKEDPLYHHVMSWLILRGNEQKDWFACETYLVSDERTIEEKLSGLQLSTPSIIRDILTVKDEVLILLCQASATRIRGEYLADDCRAQIIDAYEKHNELARGYLGELSMSDVNHAMHIRTLLISCEMSLSTISDGTFISGKQVYLDAMRCLRKLAGAIDSTVLR